MTRLVATWSDGSRVEFDDGKFDEWCVYLSFPDRPRYAPKDIEYFSILKNLGLKYGNTRIYGDFLKIYSLCSSIIDSSVIEVIDEISTFYENDKNLVSIWFAVIYAGMIAEENKNNAILKKRIKRLGMHQLLIDGMEPQMAANYSRGKNWKEIDLICRSKGF